MAFKRPIQPHEDKRFVPVALPIESITVADHPHPLYLSLYPSQQNVKTCTACEKPLTDYASAFYCCTLHSSPYALHYACCKDADQKLPALIGGSSAPYRKARPLSSSVELPFLWRLRCLIPQFYLTATPGKESLVTKYHAAYPELAAVEAKAIAAATDFMLPLGALIQQYAEVRLHHQQPACILMISGFVCARADAPDPGA
jgi:hypothetical protein